MVTNNHYDDDTLTELLRDRMGANDGDLLTHVESCETCQAQLEALSKGGLTWDEVNELLTPGDERRRLTGWTDGGANENSEVLQQSTTGFLEASEYPESLGRFDRYEIMEILGRGGMGIVMRGYDKSLNRHSAVKVLAPELAGSAAARKRFSREAKSAAAVVHPHVVPIQTVDEHAGLPYLVMPVVEGRNLDARVQDSGPRDVIEAVRIASQIADGLAAAHDQGLVHRDIKPANILLENGVERVQITDFGLARAIDDASMTRSGVITGTPQYMSPEQAHGDAIDHRSDLFSLGSLIYFMLTGRSPFRAETTMGVLNRIGNDQPRTIRTINADVPDWLEQIVAKLLEKQPAARFQTASEVAELLDGWLAHLQQPELIPPPQPLSLHRSIAKRRFSRSLLTAGGAAFLVITAAVLVVLEFGKGTIRIENYAAADVPIRIVQGDEVIDELTVTQEGATTRLRAGEYTIEVDGDGNQYQISGDEVMVTRGETSLVKVAVSVPSQKDTVPKKEDTDPEQTTKPLAFNYESVVSVAQARRKNTRENSTGEITGLSTGQKVLWRAALGSQTMRAPVVDGDRVYIGTNNNHGYLTRFGSNIDLGVLLCFQKSSGKLLWQHSNEKLPTGRVHDWPQSGVTSRPCVEGDRLWYVNNRAEIVCLDTEGFRDGENDGLAENEANTYLNDADVVWRFDMMKELGVRPHNISTCTIALWNDQIFAVTGHGVGASHLPQLASAPSFISLNRKTGKLLWQEDSPGQNILHGQWGSPTVVDFGPAKSHVIFPGGDGWLYSFNPRFTALGESRLNWKFDCNPKTSVWKQGGQGTRNNLLHGPTLQGNRIYFATGQDPEHGPGQGRVWAMPTYRTGDVSPQLVYNKRDPETPIAHRREQACIADEGDFTRPNPNSRGIWQFEQQDVNGNGKIEVEETMSRSLSTIAIKDDLLLVSDIAGVLHCLDRMTGKQYWGYNTSSAVYSTPTIVGDHVYLGTQDGEILVFELSRDLNTAAPDGRPIQRIDCGSNVNASVVADGNVLYFTTNNELIAVENKDEAGLAR